MPHFGDLFIFILEILLQLLLQEVIDFEVVTGNATRYVLSNMSNANDVIYNIALNTESGTSGLSSEWQCVFSREGTVPAKLDADLYYTDNDGDAIVHWKRDKCLKPGQARVIAYTLKFKPDGSGMKMKERVLFVVLFQIKMNSQRFTWLFINTFQSLQFIGRP